MYPDYRFQPKHDPEKKRRRQEAKAAAEAAAIREEQQRHVEEVRRQREIDGLTAPLAMPIPMSSHAMNANGSAVGAMDEAQQSMQLRRNQERERRAQHIGHRRSSSVPLPMDTYAAAAAYSFGFPPAYNAQAQSNPFNFANPALGSNNANANAQAGPIAIPTIPAIGGNSQNAGLSNLSGMLPSWYSSTNLPTQDQQQPQHSQSAGATPASGVVQLPTQGPSPFVSNAQQAATLSRTGSPRLAQSLRTNTTPFAPQGVGMLGSMAMYNQMLHNSNINIGMGAGAGGAGMGMGGGMAMNGMGGMGMGMNMGGVNVGMGARAARQHHLRCANEPEHATGPGTGHVSRLATTLAPRPCAPPPC